MRLNKIEEAQTIINELPELMIGQSDLLMLGSWLNGKGKVYIAERKASIALAFLRPAYSILGKGGYESYEYFHCLKLIERAKNL